MNFSFLEWPVRKQLAQEKNNLHRARIKILSYALHLRLVTTALLLAFYVIQDAKVQIVRISVLLAVAILFYIVVSMGANWRRSIHAAVLIFLTIIWTNLFAFEGGLNLATLQYVAIISTCSFYGLGNKWGLSYSGLAITPFILYIILGHSVGLMVPWGPEGSGNFGLAVLLFHNFIFLVLINYYFFNSFYDTIQALDSKTTELTASLNSLEQSRVRQDDELRHQKHLLASISHDIKSPLRFLMTTTARLARNYPDLPTVRAISQSSSRLYNFMKNLLEYTELRYKNSVLNLVYLDLNELVQQKFEIFVTEAEGNSAMLVNHVLPGVILKSNPQLISIILHNLIDNAIKVTYDGKITVSCTDHRNELHLTVTDSGTGMDPRIMGWINSPSKIPGTEHNAQSFGMGLLIVKELSSLVGAKLLAEPNLPSGTSVHIIFSKNSISSEFST
ncbi:sensor histidine kinase [Dyadobacter luticola]|uniref:histidine kinase n=1 Tax=Dyadobacter luticola TaxID=1979387 RepID=A0A5R9L1Q7_9BACT|nr:HAMP domain-containing sensor histidine kinase [Dyadobacter luticola]TLV02289.1 HAMP domain-containing histidine kinase [Dyadobacter luticola]